MNEIENPNLLPVAVVGCDFRRASSRWRSALMLDEAEAVELATSLRAAELAWGFVSLNTCNRNEWIVASERPVWTAEILKAQMVVRLGKKAPEPGPLPVPYTMAGVEAIRHVLQVAVGLESFVLGERQVAGQLNRAFEKARERGMSCSILNRLATCASHLARAVNKTGCFGEISRGVHSLAYRTLCQALQRKASNKIIIVGLGEIGRKLWGLLAVDNRFSVIRCNRTISPEDQDKVLPLADLSQRIAEADALVVCTGAPDAIILPEQISRRKNRQQLLILDLGIPEQVGPVPLDRKDLLRLGLDQLLCNPCGGPSNHAAIGQVEKLVEEALQIFVDSCAKREFAGLMREVQSGRQRYLSELIPRFVREFQPSLSAQQRSRMEGQLKGLISAYTHNVFNSIKATSRGKSPRGFDKT